MGRPGRPRPLSQNRFFRFGRNASGEFLRHVPHLARSGPASPTERGVMQAQSSPGGARQSKNVDFCGVGGARWGVYRRRPTGLGPPDLPEALLSNIA